jgi:23S rRNA pseudouridine2604 synthase
MQQEKFPMRINKYLALRNYGTRRSADDLVAAKKVLINGRVAVLGDMVKAEDNVDVRFREKKRYAYFAFNKPAGMNTHQEGAQAGIVASLPTALQKLKLFPVGRIDKNSSGLIILTNDGRVTDRLLNPKYEHEKEYEVRTKLPLRSSFKEKMESGVNIEGYTTKPCTVKVLGPKSFRVTLIEGKTHQIRRMLVALFNEVTDLKRTRVSNVKLGTMPQGHARAIEGAELKTFLDGLSLS